MLIDAVEWLGHSGFRVKAERTTIYIDPYRVADGAPPADLILITHGHYDHFSPRDIEALSHVSGVGAKKRRTPSPAWRP